MSKYFLINVFYLIWYLYYVLFCLHVGFDKFHKNYLLRGGGWVQQEMAQHSNSKALDNLMHLQHLNDKSFHAIKTVLLVMNICNHG